MAAPRCQAMNPQCHSSRAFLGKLVFCPLCPPHLVCGHANEDKQSLASVENPWHRSPRGSGQNRGSWGYSHAQGPCCLGRILGGGSFWYPTEHPGDEQVGVKVACGTFARLCQPQQDHARALSFAQHL